jgi:PAS domain S-box-containing protein
MAPIRRTPEAPWPLNPNAQDLKGKERLLTEVAGALRANLARGFLEGEERLREIVEALNDVVLLSDEDSGRVYFVNAAYERVWGRPRADLYANPAALLDGVHAADRERVSGLLAGRSRRDFDVEFRMTRPTGEERWLWTRGFVIPGAAGHGNRAASITTDVTERKQIADSHERLIRGFTHDVKNPLGAADGYLSLLETGVLGPLSEVQTQSIRRARRSLHNALTLLSGLLEIERAEAGRLDIERGDVDLGAAVVETVEEFHAAAATKGLGTTCSVPEGGEALVVRSDGARIRQILANLVSNAVKYTQMNGRVSIRARVAQPAEAPGAGAWVEVTVADNGPGIPLRKQSLVFREFTRFDPGAAAGSGIGLAISRRLARALGGDITFTSTPGSGSAFTLWLPFDAVVVPAIAR